MRTGLRALVPEGLRAWWSHCFGWRWFRGDYPSWAAAQAASAGYDDRAVLARVVAATREVAAGRALWERDGVAFTDAEINAPLLAALTGIGRAAGGRLDVVDFGGALGSSWWQHRPELARLGAVRWRVVEQPHYVAAGAEFAREQLGFARSLAEAGREIPPAVILFSGVLPYIENPSDLLEQAVQLGFCDVIIDRTPFIAGGRTRLAVQHTPPGLGGGSYPCWLFDEAALLAPLRMAGYEQIAVWPALDRLDPGVEHRGFHFRRKT